MSEKLKPCPFCGGGAAFVKHSAGMRGTMAFDSWDAVACRSCGGTVGACDRRFRNKEDARKAWNLRAPVVIHGLEATPVVNQKQANLSDNAAPRITKETA